MSRKESFPTSLPGFDLADVFEVDGVLKQAQEIGKMAES
ncbi:hypothetical protein D1BOALGB6SA_1571 [Olavius sp. associated proteobacterium Delta 1]|nr:hypothetical protein D1BOALGB6SA_1571 [Olavius sp. associated proteobacterium Delta 1]